MRFGLLAVAALAAFLSSSCSPKAAQTGCPANFFGGQAPDLKEPKLANKAHELCYSEFAVLYSGLTRTPLWSAEHLTAQRVITAGRQHRKDSTQTFHEETAISADERSFLSDYVRGGHDRGHMSPNGDMDNPEAQGESFTLANMVPQDADNNRHIWAAIEKSVRDLARKHGEAWVVTVPIFAGAQTTWLHNRVAIPVKIAKAVYVPSANIVSVYLTDNAPGEAWQAISVAQLRQMSGIDVFPGLPESAKNVVSALPTPKIFAQNTGE